MSADRSVWTAEGPCGVALVVTRMNSGKWVPAIPAIGARGPEFDTRTAAQRACEWLAGSIAGDTSASLAALLGDGWLVTIEQFGGEYLCTATSENGARRRASAVTPAEAVALAREQAFPRGPS
jgi:hypothetical protein